MVSLPPFRATVAEVGERFALVSISGELGLYVESDLRAALASAAELGAPTVVVDLSGVSFLDSTVCGILLGESRRLRRDASELVLVSSRNLASRAFAVSGIDRVVRVYPTLHAALEELLLEPVP